MSEELRDAGPLEQEPLCVRNRLTYPNDVPIMGDQVSLIMRAFDGWRDDRTGRVLGEVTAWTDRNGVWASKLLPYSAFEPRLQDYIYVDVYERRQLTGRIRVRPPRHPGETVWLRDLLVDAPTPTPGQWKPLDMLAKLLDVDRGIEKAPDGSALVKHGGVWTFHPYRLTSLTDVDPVSTALASPGDKLEYLSSAKGWGIKQDAPPPTNTLWFRAACDPTDPTGFTITCEITERQQRPAVIDWGDGITSRYEVGETTKAHTYTDEQGFPLTAKYADGNQEPGKPVDGSPDWFEIPTDCQKGQR